MVKLHKPIPKTIKKSDPEFKKIQTKIVKTNAKKEIAKKVKKTLEAVDANKAKNVKTKGPVLDKEKSVLHEMVNKTISKKKPLIKKSVQNGESKRIPALQEKTTVVKEAEPKKKAVTKNQAAKNVAVKQSALEANNIKKSVQTKVQQTARKPVVTKHSDAKVDSKKGKVPLKKNQQDAAKLKKPVNNKIQPNTQNHVDKKKIVVQKVLEENKKVSSQKAVITKEGQPQQSGKKSVVKKSDVLTEKSKTVKAAVPKAKVINKKVPGKKQVAAQEQNKVEKPGQKKLNSKVQKKLSAEKKNQLNLKSKVQKNIVEVKKMSHKDQEETVKSDEEKSLLYEQQDFDENKFKEIVSFENIKKIGKALKELVEKQVSEKKADVFSDYQYFLNVACYKIPNCPKRVVKLNLKHALVNTDLDDVVLIVPDLQRGAKVDFEPTIQHYDDVLRKNGIENITVLPFNQLRKEYSSFEALRKLSNRYDHYLCDGRIVGHVVGFCGKHFRKPRTTLHAVDLSNPKKLKSEIEHALKRTSYRQLNKGDLSSILVGSHRFTADHLAENIENVIQQLKTLYPGGYANIRNIYIKIDIKGTSSLPIYVSLSGPPEEVPNIIGPREQRMINLKKQANEILSKFNLSKTGEIVKLSKAQAKRKQEILKTREALTSGKNVEDEDDNEVKPPLMKKLKKQTKLDEEKNGDKSDEGAQASENESEENDQEDEESDENNEEDDADDGEVSDAETEENEEDDEESEENNEDDEMSDEENEDDGDEVSDAESEENDDDGGDSECSEDNSV